MRGSSAGARGISELPMQLLIGAVLMSAATVAFYSAYEDLSENLADEGARRSVGVLLRTMEDVLSGDAGSRLEVTIELDGFGSCGFERLEIGGDLSMDDVGMYIIRYELSSGLERKYSLDPPFPITSDTGGSLLLNEGVHRLSIEKVERDGKGHLSVSSG